MISLTTMLK